MDNNFGGPAEQNPEGQAPGNQEAPVEQAEAQAPAAAEGVDEDMRRELVERGQNVAMLMENVDDQYLMRQLEDEMR